MSDFTRSSIEIRGIELCYFEWGPEYAGKSESILLLHATGFHARCWDKVVAAMPGRHIIAVDFRGHGRSGRKGPYNWDIFGLDIIDFVDALQLSNLIGVGHSMGGRVLCHVAIERLERFARLVLIDPVILEASAYRTWKESGGAGKPEDHPTSKRRNHWQNWQQMYTRFASRSPFNLWDERVLEDYCQYGVVAVEGREDLELACPPLVEAEIYANSGASDITPQLGNIKLPVAVLRAQRRVPGQGEEQHLDFTKSPTWPELAQQFEFGRDIYLPQLSHFIPMQKPECVAQVILDAEADW